MSEPIAPVPPALQFDRAIPADSSATSGIACAQCGRTISDSYYHLAQRPLCAECKDAIERAYASTLTAKSFIKALAFGLAGAVAGAIIYYAVIALTNLEIGIVAILIGYMVGYAIRRAVGGAGARRYQVAAAVLTYFAVGLAYLPIAMKESLGDGKTGADSTRVAGRDTAATTQGKSSPSPASPSIQFDSTTATGTSETSMSFGKALAVFVFLVFALPVMVIVGSFPSGLISALIIGFGILQAWRMTAAPNLSFHGPLKVSPSVDPPAAAGDAES